MAAPRAEGAPARRQPAGPRPMNSDRWRALQDLFADARSLQGEPREALLREQARTDPELVAQARALLDADATPGVIDALAPHFTSVVQLLDDPAPARIGAYRIVGEIGRGG